MSQETETPQEAPDQPSLPEATLDALPPKLQDALKRAKWTQLMPVQAKAIPYMLEGRDLMVQSRTGSGKTGAFLMPMLERLDPKKNYTQAIIMVPTRELAKQVCSEAEILFGNELRSVAVYGGVGYGAQLEALQKGAHLVVGTPGRILDHLMRRSLLLDKVRILVFDEADHMLSVGFYPDMKALAMYLPKERDSYMFSATYPPRVLSLANQFLTDPEMMNLSTGTQTVAETEHIAYQVPTMEKDRCLVRIIEIENPDSAIIFTNTKATARFVSVVLQRFGYDADLLSADLNQKERERVLGRLRKQQLRFLVATDVAARGIDISHLSHVFLYECPEHAESYVHRTGRTGRAGASGEAISLVDPVEMMELRSVARQYEVDLEIRDVPTDADVQAVVSARVTTLLETKLRKLDRLVAERMQRMIPLAKKLAESGEELAVIAMLLDEYYQATLHAPPDLPPLEDEPAPLSGAGSDDNSSYDSGPSGGGGGGRRSGRRGSRKRRRGR